MTDNPNFENEIYRAYLEGLKSVDRDALLQPTWHQPYSHSWKMTRYTNKRVYETWGSEVDSYLHAAYRDYNTRTEVVIIADSRRQTLQYTHFKADKNDLRLIDRVCFGRIEFRQIVINLSTMFIAYAPEINTLFIRTLFEITHTEVDPNDIMDIESRIGI